MDTPLTHAARIELARSLRRRYQAASSRSKKQILEELTADHSVGGVGGLLGYAMNTGAVRQHHERFGRQ
jgi:hypothetical protein